MNSKKQRNNELPVCGFEAVKALAEMHPEKINRLFFAKDKVKYFGNVCKMLAEKRQIYRTVEDENELEKLSGSVHHQGVVAMIDYPEIPLLENSTLNQWAENQEKVILCDRVGNSQNFGAIIRSAAFFGISNIVVSAEDGQSGITTSAYRVAQGGMEHVNIHKVSSAAWFLSRAEGKFIRVAAHHYGRAYISDLHEICNNGGGIIAVLGNEETGISPEARKLCDYLVKIPGTGAVESLNVAQAAAVFIYELVQCGKTKTQSAGTETDDAGQDSHSDFEDSFRKHRLF